MDYNENFNIPVPSLLTDMDVEAYKKLEITMSKEEKSFLKIITINAAGLNDEDLIPKGRTLKDRRVLFGKNMINEKTNLPINDIVLDYNQDFNTAFSIFFSESKYYFLNNFRLL